MNPLFFRAFRDSEIRLHELNYLFWECTSRCNLHCRHCGSDCGSARTCSDMPLETFLSALDTIPRDHRPKGFTVVLTGGEPLLRPDICKIGKSVCARGFSWGMVSNGYFYDQAAHRSLMDAGMGSLTISLDGLQTTHDWMRGRQGSFEKALGAIRLAAGEKRLFFDVVTCVQERNYPQLEDIYRLLLECGVPAWRLVTIIPIGRAATDPQMRLGDEHTKGLMDFIVAKRREGKMQVRFGCEGYLGPYEEKVREGRFFCRAGVNIASVLIDGTISACPDVDRKLFCEGNVYRDNFYEVWQNGFKDMRDRSAYRTGACKGCAQWKNCLGGGIHDRRSGLEGPLTCHYNILAR